jgi:hypothetical protein
MRFFKKYLPTPTRLFLRVRMADVPVLPAQDLPGIISPVPMDSAAQRVR